MNLSTLKSGIDQLTDSLADSQETAAHQEDGDWIGWDSWVDVNQQTASARRSSASRPITGIRPGSEADLDAINRVIGACVMTWNIPDRVKRLSLSSYHYNAVDLKHFRLFVAYDQTNRIIGVTALESIKVSDQSTAEDALLLHGIFVDPSVQGLGVGRLLVKKCLEICGREKRKGLLVKAQPDAIGFFKALRFKAVSSTDSKRDYPHQLWMDS